MAYPRHTQGISKVEPRYIQGISKAYPRHIQGIPKTYPMHIQGGAKVYPRYIQGISKAYPRHTQGISKAYPRHILANLYPPDPYPGTNARSPLLYTLIYSVLYRNLKIGEKTEYRYEKSLLTSY